MRDFTNFHMVLSLLLTLCLFWSVGSLRFGLFDFLFVNL